MIYLVSATYLIPPSKEVRFFLCPSPTNLLALEQHVTEIPYPFPLNLAVSCHPSFVSLCQVLLQGRAGKKKRYTAMLEGDLRAPLLWTTVILSPFHPSFSPSHCRTFTHNTCHPFSASSHLLRDFF